jgi:molybdopterin converting factor small subunit
MKLNVEFLGLTRKLAQTKESLVEMDEQATLRDVLGVLAVRFPALVGPVIVPETFDLVSSHLVNLDGRRAAENLDMRLQDGQRLIFMFMEAGG